jgi:leucyl aminopeptidase
LFANDEALAADLVKAGTEAGDAVWRMPLWKPYDDMFASDVADFANADDSGQAGAVTAALFLARFVPEGLPWAHFDTFAWRPSAKPGRPKGGDAMGLRATWTLLSERYAR